MIDEMKINEVKEAIRTNKPIPKTGNKLADVLFEATQILGEKTYGDEIDIRHVKRLYANILCLTRTKTYIGKKMIPCIVEQSIAQAMNYTN